MQARRAERCWATPGTVGSFSPYTPQGLPALEVDKIRDISTCDCAFDTKGNVNLQVGTRGELSLSAGNTPKVVKDAKVERTWANGMAVSFPNFPEFREFFDFRKHEEASKKAEIRRKKELALAEIGLLSSDVRLIKDCQVRIFIACLTVAIAVASVLTLMTSLERGSPHFKTLIAFCPAWVAIICAAMSLQKFARLNLTESFIMHLKQRLNQGTFFVFYTGWEDALARFHNCKGMTCTLGSRCLDQALNNLEQISWWSRLRSQSFWFPIVLLFTYALIYLASVISTLVLFTKIPEKPDWGLFLVPLLIGTLISMVLVASVLWATYHVFLERYSLMNYYYAWEQVLNRCPPFHPERLKPRHLRNL